MFLLWLRQLPRCEDQTPASVPPPTKGRSSPTNIPISPPSSFVLLSFAWVYIFFSAGQVLLSALSWCVLTYPWREIYSMSTYSSAILSLPRHTLERLTKASWSCSINLIPSLTWHKTSLGIHWGIFLDGIHNISDCLTSPFTFPSKSQMNQLLAWNRGP